MKNEINGIPMYNLYLFLTLFLFVCCNTNRKNSIECTDNSVVTIHQYIDTISGTDVEYSDNDFFNNITRYEKSIGSVMLFIDNSKDTSCFSPFKDILLNPPDKWNDGTPKTLGSDRCFDCFLGHGLHTYIVALRPQIHPFIKEIAIYGYNDYGDEYSYCTYYYYRNRTLDQLIPRNILAQYQKDSFNIDEFWCFRDQLLEALDKYHGVGEPAKIAYDDGEKRAKKKERFIEREDMCFIDNIVVRENFTGTDEDYNWFKKNRKEMKCYGWYTVFPQPFVNKLYVNSFNYDTDMVSESGEIGINAGTISSPKDMYLQLQLTYRKDYIDEIIYK